VPNARILVVEDESIVAMDIQTRLGRLGYTVVGHAATGDEAVKKAEETRPDLVLMDIRLQGDMDGVEAAAQVRSRFNIPVVYVTAFSDEETLHRAKVTEPFGYILKPFETRELLTAIEMGLYKHRGEQALRQKNEELEKRVKELSALNSMFQQHLKTRFEAEERCRELQTALRTFLHRVGELASDLERKATDLPPSSVAEATARDGQSSPGPQ